MVCFYGVIGFEWMVFVETLHATSLRRDNDTVTTTNINTLMPGDILCNVSTMTGKIEYVNRINCKQLYEL
jgi:hypothetical protein